MGLSSSPPPFPDYRHYSPPPSNCLCNALYRHLSSRSATGAEINGTGPDGCLPELDMFPLLQVMCLWYMCFCAEVFFFCSQTVLQMEHSLGVKKFFSSSLSSCKSCIFLNTLSPVLSTPLSYVCCVCMDRLMANFAGTCTSDNKGLLLLLHNRYREFYSTGIPHIPNSHTEIFTSMGTCQRCNQCNICNSYDTIFLSHQGVKLFWSNESHSFTFAE